MGTARPAAAAHSCPVNTPQRRISDPQHPAHARHPFHHHPHNTTNKQMKDIIQWCIDLGVRVISVYAFSIDNFKRPAGEVEDLMQLATDKFEELLHVSV